MQPLEALAATPVFCAADPGRLAATAGLWTERSVRPGQVLWYEDEPAEELAVVMDGGLEVLSGGRKLATVAPGELIGEASAFVAGETRTLTLRADRPTRLLVLAQSDLRDLRRSHEDVYDLLLDRALITLAERVENTLTRIAELGQDDLRPSSIGIGESGVELRLRDSLECGQPPSPMPALRLLPILSGAQDAVLTRLRWGLTPHMLEAGEMLVREGDLGHAVYLVAEGEIAVRKAVGSDQLPLATLHTGALLGTGGLLLGRPRNASCVAARRSWVYAMNRESFCAMRGEPGRMFREALLCALRMQTKSANAQLTRLYNLRERSRPRDLALDELLSAAGTALVFQGGGGSAAVELSSAPLYDPVQPSSGAKVRLLEYIRSSIIGADEALEGPYGLSRITYADYGTSARCLRFIEDFIRDEVMPFYGSTHSEASGTGRQTSRYREDAREIIRQCVGAGEDDAVIFCGSGATAAINKLVDILNLRLPADLSHLSERLANERRPVVFIGPYEHHSNLLPWLQSIASVVVIGEDADGGIDRAEIERALIEHARRPLRIGSFCAASNVTGIPSDVAGISKLLHRHGALAFWDYAGAAPHVRVEMNLREDGPEGELAYQDALFFSPHKFIGGPGAPGVLVVKKRLIGNRVPTQPGSGTVDLVTPDTTLYSEAPEQREEAGTPAILGSVRAGLVFQLQRAVGTDTIAEMEYGFLQRAIEAWRNNPNLRLLADNQAERSSLVSFMVRYRHHYLHNDFVVTLLNDLFGVQARSGSSCAGPYMHRLLGLGPELSARYVSMVERGFASLRPGWSRIDFNYFISQAEFRYLVTAVNLTALYGHLLLPHYSFDVRSGQWRHRRGQPHEPMRLSDLRYGSGRLEYPSRHARVPEDALDAQIERAMRVFEAARRERRPRTSAPPYDAEYERLRWFALPEDVIRDQESERAHEPGANDGSLDYRVRTYSEALAAAYGGSTVSPEASAVLQSVRRSLRITPEEHAAAWARAGIG